MKPRSGAARRYARALLDVALEKGSPEVVAGELKEAVMLLDSHRELRGILAHPALGAERKRAIVSEVWRGRTESEIVPRLISLLAERDRMEMLGDVLGFFAELWNAHRGVVAAEATTAQALDTHERNALTQALGRAVGKEVDLAMRVDPEVLGGVLVRMGGRTYDGTVKGRLRALRAHLAEGGGARRTAAPGTMSGS